MELLRFILISIVGTLLRGLPFPQRTGLITLGRPDRGSPVFLTGNFRLTVERVKRALRRIDCYLLVADSKGINVWCAATGGHFTNHAVISSLKLSGVDRQVDHRNVVLPQLAATGIEAGTIRERTGWNVTWGPVYAGDIPAFLDKGLVKTARMREVRFPLMQRMEMVVAWAFPFSLVAGIVALSFWRGIALPLTGLIWAVPFFLFLTFPLYAERLRRKNESLRFSKYTVLFDFGRVPLLLWAVFLFCLVGYGIASGHADWRSILRWGIVSFLLVALVSIDLWGSTPTYKSGLHDDRLLKVVLDPGKCKGAGSCEMVCPRNCFDLDPERHRAEHRRADKCVQCGACIVQCPFDALWFRDPKGNIVSPETVRRFKLNVLGKRLKDVGGAAAPLS